MKKILFNIFCYSPLFYISLLLVLFFVEAESKNYLINLFGADKLFPQILFNDIQINGLNLNSWSFPTAPSYFPDMLVYGIIFSVFKNVHITRFIYAFIQFLAIIFLSGSILKRISGKKIIGIAVFSFFFSFFLLATIFNFKIDRFSSYLVTNNFHVCVFIDGLLILLLTVLYYQNNYKWKYLLFIFLTVVIGIISDKLFVLFIIIPLLGATIIQILLAKDWKRLIFPVTIIIGLTVSVILNKIININTYERNFNVEILSFSEIVKNLRWYYSQFFSQISIVTLIVVLSFIAILASLYQVCFNYKNLSIEKKVLFLTFLFSYPLVLIAPFILDIFKNYAATRYNISIYYFSSLALTLNVLQFNKSHTKILNIIVSCFSIILLVSALLISPVSISKGLKAYFNYKPVSLKCIEANKQQLGLKNGIAEYHTSKRIMGLSENEISVHTVYNSSFLPHSILSNKNWYTGSGNSNETIYNFIITNTKSNALAAKKVFSNNIDTICKCSNSIQLIKTKDFSYSNNSIQFIE